MKPIVFVNKGVPEKAVQLLNARKYLVVQGKNIKNEGKGAHGILCLLTDKVDAKTMDVIGPQLKIISNMAAGLDNIDLAAAKKRNIIVGNTPGVLTEAVAEHAVALLLALARRIVEGDSFMRKKKYKGWRPDLLLGKELQGKVLGIVGHGRIGCRVADILQKGFSMRALYYDVVRDRKAEETCAITFASLSDLLRNSDAVSLHVPLLPSTRHLISRKELVMMKRTAYLVNTSRGAVIEEKALVAALKKGEIAGAGLDVFEEEPKLAPGLAKLGNVVLSPHLGSATKEARGAMAEMAAKNIIVALENL
jgi:glyoxylate reductase